jgi:very-short-patch-repair endonuclease
VARTKRIGSPHPERAKSLRRALTEPEQRLWKALRARQLGELKFRRQTAVGPYIADFLCLEAMLIVEVDGDTHAHSQMSDAKRTAFLESQGFNVMRFSNADVMSNLEGVLVAILAAVPAPSPSQAFGLGPSLSRGERGA